MTLRSAAIGIVLASLVGLSASDATAEPVPLNMGFYLPAIRDAKMADLKVSLGLWTEEIGKPYGVKIRTSTYDDMASIRRALDRAELNFINAPGMELAEVFTPEEIRQGYARRHHGIDEGLVLVSTRESGIQRFADLRGKRVARLNNDHLSEYFLETLCLKTAGLDCRDYLTLSEEKRDIQSVYNVFFGRIDAALVQTSTLRTAEELNPQIGKRLKAILDWKAKALIFGMMTRHTDESYRSLILNSSREALKTPRGQQLLELFKTDYLDPVDADALKPYWALLKEYRELRKSRTAKTP
jgi:ABC-type phosphate/phosphonate transport system substrate-binding protein